MYDNNGYKDYNNNSNTLGNSHTPIPVDTDENHNRFTKFLEDNYSHLYDNNTTSTSTSNTNNNTATATATNNNNNITTAKTKKAQKLLMKEYTRNLYIVDQSFCDLYHVPNMNYQPIVNNNHIQLFPSNK